MSDMKQNLLLFFERPAEPCFMEKGDDKVVFQIPDHYYPEKYQAVASTLNNRFAKKAGRSVLIRNIALPDLSVPMQLPYNEQFSLFLPQHKKMAARLIDIFLGMRDIEELLSVCSFCQLRINPYMFNYCLSVCILHRPDTRGLDIPSFMESFPDKFVDPKVFRVAREITRAVPAGQRPPITIPRNHTASDLEPEQRVAYFREDIGVNLHHWHWHLVYPDQSANRSIVDKDRRGELFYYMHQQIMARYDVERLCNELGRVVPFNQFREPIAEGYFPKLTSQLAGRNWPPRFANTFIRDLERPDDLIKNNLYEFEAWRDRFVATVDNMAITLPDGQQVPLDEETGIDVLGNIMEASSLSPNEHYYGNLHNLGHLYLGYSHDPDNRHLEKIGVMGDNVTAMRDPVFYRWHAFVNDMFVLYKDKLPAYGPEKLNFFGVRVSGISIEGAAGANTLATLWEQSTVDLKRGLDFSPSGSMPIRYTHLQHENFDYVIDVSNTGQQAIMGTVRIFIAPVEDEKGGLLSFEEQRHHMIELDKFAQELKPGDNTIRRRSLDSSVTIPYERTFRDQSPRPGLPGSGVAEAFDFCGCGWPHHMLVPKGTAKGYPMVLFCMISKWNEDRVQQELASCSKNAASYCGIRDGKYPDRHAMGFPFDRPAPASSLLDFLQPNMAVQNCTVRFTDRTRVRGQQ